MNYEDFFAERIEALQGEGNYRVFADLERKKGDFPHANNYRGGKVEVVTVWCSNDYLDLFANRLATQSGQNPLNGFGFVRWQQHCQIRLAAISSLCFICHS